MDISKYIVPTIIKNKSAETMAKWLNTRSQLNSTNFETEDYVYIDNMDGLKNLSQSLQKCEASEFAKVNGIDYVFNKNTYTCDCGTWLNDVFSLSIPYVSPQGNILYVENPAVTFLGIKPIMNLSAFEVSSNLRSANPDFELDVSNKTITFGKFPQTYMGNSRYLEDSLQKGKLVKTGKQYLAHYENEKPVFAKEYHELGMSSGHEYCRIDTSAVSSTNKNAYKYFKKTSQAWFLVEPIVWNIRNWEELPTYINPNGSNTATTIELQSKYVLTAMPFFPKKENGVFTTMLWQNSPIRGYLNGYNVDSIKANGNVQFGRVGGGDFSQYNFLSQAFDYNNDLVKNIPDTNENMNIRNRTIEDLEKYEKLKSRPNPYGVEIESTPMDVNEQIKFYIKNGKSFMLHGPSGIGKSRRIEEADPDYVPIVLRNGMLPEEVIGKTIYPNNDKTKAGTWTPPAWYALLCEKCKEEKDQNHVLFIDEITNVKPTEQSLVYHLVLNHSIGANYGKLPDNVVVVAAGNNPNESESAYNMPEPLFRRFEGHIELKPDISEWIAWGSSPSTKYEGKTKIHPLIMNFVATYGMKVFYSDYDAEVEEKSKYAIDPRGWEQISDIIYSNNGKLAYELIENKVGKEIANSLLAFAKMPVITIKDVMEGTAELIDLPKGFDGKYALALSLRNAGYDEVGKVREFILNNLGKEILTKFDLSWIGDDNEKAIYLSNLKKEEIHNQSPTK